MDEEEIEIKKIKHILLANNMFKFNLYSVKKNHIIRDIATIWMSLLLKFVIYI